MSDVKVSVGNVEIISLSDGTGENLMKNVFPDVPPAEWKRYPDFISPEGKLKSNYGCFAIRSGGKTILVDTGIGPGYPGRLLDEMREKGVDVNEITIVAITHIHPDHVGWNITRENGQERLTFPKAKYWIPKTDWDFYREPPFVKEMVLPLEKLGALELVDGKTPISSEVTMVPTPGHTPGHMSIAISSQGQQGFILGDIAGQPFQAEETAWEMSFDNDKALASRTREAILGGLERDGSLVGGGHFAPPSFGRFVRSEGRRYWHGL